MKLILDNIKVYQGNPKNLLTIDSGDFHRGFCAKKEDQVILEAEIHLRKEITETKKLLGNLEEALKLVQAQWE